MLTVKVLVFFFLKILRPPRSTRTDTLFPTRRSSDLPLIHTLNLAHLMPLSSVWAGPARNDHLAGPPLLYAETSGSTPFRLSTPVGDVGHQLIVGPTGAGKSVLLALLALQ